MAAPRVQPCPRLAGGLPEGDTARSETRASLAVSAGGNVLALARMLGHEDPSLTLRTYADLFDSDLDALADVIDHACTAALRPSIANADSEPERENVLDTLEQTA